MKEENIAKRIKELQSDSKYTFKLTEDVISIVYRTAIEDMSNENKDVIVASSKELNKKFGSKQNNKITTEQIIQRTKRDIYLEILKEIESKNDLMDVYIYVKEKCKEYGEPGIETDYRFKRRNEWM